MLSEITNLILIGDISDALNEKKLLKRGVSAVFNVASEIDENFNKIRYYKYPLTECLMNKQILKNLMRDIHLEIKLKNKIVVHCNAGIDRSPTIVTCYLILNGMKKDKAWNLVKNKRPIVFYHGHWINKLINMMN